MEDKNIIVINENGSEEFTAKVNEALKQGYCVSSSSCGYVPEPYDCEYFMAILIKNKENK